MNFDFEAKDTICALATAPGTAGIAVIRISGSLTSKILSQLCPSLKLPLESHKVYFSKLYRKDVGSLAGSASERELIDECLISFFAEGRGYTGQESAEISCHGSPSIVAEILEQIVACGARAAKPGEFSFRAFVNQKIDLVQAESVLSLVHAESRAAARLALRQLQGSLSKQFHVLEDKLIWILANLEASIDFTTEDIQPVDYAMLSKRCMDLSKEIDSMISSFSTGRVLANGLHISIVGKPNAGKSSLLNQILDQDKAIVSDIPGTTRDCVEGELHISGLKVKFIDTAGLRETTDSIESIGIRKSQEALAASDLVIVLLDPLDPDVLQKSSYYSDLKDKNTFIVFSKKDLLAQNKAFLGLNIDEKLGKMADIFIKNHDILAENTQVLAISSIQREGLDLLLQNIKTLIEQKYSSQSASIFHTRHYEGLLKIKEFLDKSQKMLLKNDSPDFISFELHECVFALHELLGKRFDDQVMDRVFREFCIGK